MKKFSLLLVAALVAICGYAQTTGSHGETISEHGVITAMPEGAKVKNYEFNSLFGQYNAESQQIDQYEENRKLEVVEFEDGTMFFKNLVSETNFNTYVQGRREAGKVIIPADQPMYYSESYQTCVLLKHTIFDWSGDILEGGDITFTVTQSGAVEKLSFAFGIEDIHYISAVMDDEDGSFVAIGDREVTISYFPEDDDREQAIVMPDGMLLKTYNCRAYSYGATAESGDDVYPNFYVYMGEDGDDVYLSGIYYLKPEYVVKGKREGDKIVFPQYQFLGLNGNGAGIFAVACAIGLDGDGDEIIVDRDNWTLTRVADKDEYDGGETVLRFARDRFYAYGNSYEQIDEIYLTLVDATVVENATVAPAANTIYDLQGRQLKAAKGLVLVNEGGKVVKRFVK